jgi:septal ring factor EnvC (AmiA/AmiB activator)
VAAEEEATRGKQLKALQQRMHVVEKTIRAGQRDQSKEVKQLRQIETSLGASTKKIKGLGKKQADTQLKIRRLQQQQNGLIVGIEEQKFLLAEQLRTAHALGKQHKVKLLLNQQQPARINRVLQYYDYFNQSRLEKVDALRRTVEELSVIENQLATEQTQMAAVMQETKTEAWLYKRPSARENKFWPSYKQTLKSQATSFLH